MYGIQDWIESSLQLLLLLNTYKGISDNNSTADEYSSDMLKCKSYCGICELIAAGLILPFQFEVFRNGLLYTDIALTIAFSVGIADTPINNFAEVLKILISKKVYECRNSCYIR